MQRFLIVGIYIYGTKITACTMHDVVQHERYSFNPRVMYFVMCFAKVDFRAADIP